MADFYDAAKVDALLADKASTAEVNAALAGKQDLLTPGENITIKNNVISVSGDPKGYSVSVASDFTLDVYGTGGFSNFFNTNERNSVDVGLVDIAGAVTWYNSKDLYNSRGMTIKTGIVGLLLKVHVVDDEWRCDCPHYFDYLAYGNRIRVDIALSYNNTNLNEIGAFYAYHKSTHEGLTVDKTTIYTRLVASGTRFVPLMSDIIVVCTTAISACLLKGTRVTLSNMLQKPIEDITYDDELLVWDFDNGQYSSAKPAWIKKAEKNNYYFRNVFSDGTELYVTGESATGWGHRVFDINKSKFVYVTETTGDRVFTRNGYPMHRSCERIDEPCEFYNIITEKHFNLFANGILTSCSLNNLYPIECMMFKKPDGLPRTAHTKDEFADIPVELISGLRLTESVTETAALIKYVHNIMNVAVPKK